MGLTIPRIQLRLFHNCPHNTPSSLERAQTADERVCVEQSGLAQEDVQSVGNQAHTEQAQGETVEHHHEAHRLVRA